jgi:hypothetical protein
MAPAGSKAIVRLYSEGEWSFMDSDRSDGFSVVLFGPHGGRYARPQKQVVDHLCGRAGVSSIQITFDENRPAHLHSMPPGGFRLAIVNCRELAAGRAVRAELARLFWQARHSPQRSSQAA